ncbi:hypothetical protein KF840_07275 [bacterium]|nr:hypothetical protein [bacterium]
MRRRHSRRRILAIDPTHRGFGYVVLEGPDRLVDWGLSQWRSGEGTAAIKRVGDLIRRLAPDVLVIEDTSHRDCRRSQRVRRLLRGVAIAAAKLEICTRLLPAAVVRARFAALGATNKDAVARILAERFPELATFLPPPRKPWRSEDERMAIFDALALSPYADSRYVSTRYRHGSRSALPGTHSG